MNIDYKDIHEFSKDDLEDLFLSVEWSSGHYGHNGNRSVVVYEYIQS